MLFYSEAIKSVMRRVFAADKDFYEWDNYLR